MHPKQWGKWAGRELIQAGQREPTQDKWMLAQAQAGEDKLRPRASGRETGFQRQVGHRPPSSRPCRVQCSHCIGRKHPQKNIRRNNEEVRDPSQLGSGNKKPDWATGGKRHNRAGVRASWLAVRPAKGHTPPHRNSSPGDSLQTRMFLWYIWQNEKLNKIPGKTHLQKKQKIFKD